MNTHRAGKAAEKRVTDLLAAEGYVLVTSQLSRGPADLLAAKAGQVLAVQVKRSWRSGGGVGPASWNALLDHAAAFGAVPVVAVAPPRRPVQLWELTGRKDGSGGRQPMREFRTDEVVTDAAS